MREKDPFLGLFFYKKYKGGFILNFFKSFKFYSFLFIVLCVFVFTGFTCTASSTGDAVYQTIINYIVSNYGDSYSWYLDNKHVCIFDTTQVGTLDFWADYPVKGTSERYNMNNNNYRYMQYLAIFCENRPELHYEETLQTIDNNNYDQVLWTNKVKFYVWIYNTGECFFFRGSNYNFYFQTGINLIYNDDNILVYDYQSNLVDAIESSNYTLNPTQVPITGNETQSEMYQKVLSWFNANANFYANIWASGDTPSCLILDNRNRDVVANLYSNNSSPNYDFIVCLSQTRFCAYELNNNSFHYNFLTYQNKQFWYLLVDVGNSNNFTFYRYNINNQTDCAVVTQNTNNRIFLCTKDIFLKYNSNNFILDNDGKHELFYSSLMENSPVYPVNPDGGSSSSGGGSVWTTDDIIGFQERLDSLNDSIDDLDNNFFQVAQDYLVTAISPLINQLSSVLGMGYLFDIITYISSLKSDALLYKQAILDNNGFNLTFTFLNTNFTFNPFNFFFLHIYAYFYRIINMCFLFYICFFSYGKIYKLIRKLSWGDSSINISKTTYIRN